MVVALKRDGRQSSTVDAKHKILRANKINSAKFSASVFSSDYAHDREIIVGLVKC